MTVRVLHRVSDERAARDALRDQIARLETDLCEFPASRAPARRAGPQLLTLGELEEVRDSLALRLADERRALARRADEQEQSRRLIEEMLLAPEEHKWTRVSHEDIGEPGCCDYHVRPRFGVLGMLMKWWRVRISSGCP